ncbi:2Fe-2S iron-sulfur cluster-binding protein [Microbacterium sp. NPDC097977]|uniref:2Fe-2S iron-sulfur cluster-binding protein n=1 Tax=Microbacterium sp. NPDC097977 TaxID=3155686 RepID=UPI003332532C
MSDDTIVFTFEGRQLTGRPGMSIAAALASHDVRTLSRGVKYHRPRGYTCGFSACGDCPLNVNGLPGVESCSTELEQDDVVKRELGWPNTSFDIFRAADFIAKWIPAGFQFRLFTRSPRLSRLSGRALKHLAGGGRFPSPNAVRAARAVRVERVDADVVVVGAGASGLQSALSAAEMGRSVLLVERAIPTARADVRTEEVIGVDGSSGPRSNAMASLRAAVGDDSRIRTISGVAFGVLDDTVLVNSGRTRWEIAATHLVVATGGYETAPLFRNNDRPGIYLADGALKLRRETGRPLGQRVVIATDSDRGYEVAEALRNQGDTVARILDTRSNISRTHAAAESGTQLIRVRGWGRVKSIVYRRAGSRVAVRADALVLAFQRRPAEEIVLQAMYADEEGADGMALTVVGTASGDHTSDLRRTTTTIRQTLPASVAHPKSAVSLQHPTQK